MYLEDIKICDTPIVKGLDTSQNITHYQYISKSDFTSAFGEPDNKQSRISELYETEIVKLTYGLSSVEFYDYSFGEGLPEEEYKILGIELNDSSLWLSYDNEKIVVGKRLDSFYSPKEEDDKVYLELRRGELNQVSDYACVL
jgi:hypothetical protein